MIPLRFVYTPIFTVSLESKDINETKLPAHLQSLVIGTVFCCTPFEKACQPNTKPTLSFSTVKAWRYGMGFATSE